MATRLTDTPYIITRRITESAANIFTTVPISMPFPAPAAGQNHAVEICKVESDLQQPNEEVDQENRSRMQLVRDLQTSILNFTAEQVIWTRDLVLRNRLQVAEGQTLFLYDRIQYHDLMVSGRGVVYIEKNIHLQIQGIGNASAMDGGVRIYIHLVKLTNNEVKQRLLARNVGGGSGEGGG